MAPHWDPGLWAQCELLNSYEKKCSKNEAEKRERNERVGGKAKERYRTISPPRSIVGGLLEPEYTGSVSGTGKQREKLKREGDSVCGGVCVVVFCIHTPSGCCSEMRQYVRCLQASIRPFLLFIADYSAKSYNGEYFLMSFEIQQRKFVRFFVCLNLAGGGEKSVYAGVIWLVRWCV